MISAQTQHCLPHWRLAEWDRVRWPNFSPRELACRASGEFYWDIASFDALQAMRRELGAPILITSGHRSALHNARIGGAPLSAHLQFAADIQIAGHDRRDLLDAARRAGFTRFGFYETFLHCDRRPEPTVWFGSGKARQLWTL